MFQTESFLISLIFHHILDLRKHNNFIQIYHAQTLEFVEDNLFHTSELNTLSMSTDCIFKTYLKIISVFTAMSLV